jgi:hypothetical protein
MTAEKLVNKVRSLSAEHFRSLYVLGTSAYCRWIAQSVHHPFMTTIDSDSHVLLWYHGMQYHTVRLTCSETETFLVIYIPE